MLVEPEKLDAVRSLVKGAVKQSDDGEIIYCDGQTPPSDSAINAKLASLTSEWEAVQYIRDRQYPDLGEQLDMLFHDMTAGKGTKDGEWYKAVAKVKTDNPKPTE